VSVEGIKEIERMLYVNNRTLLVWKPEPVEPVRRVDEIMKPINVNKFHSMRHSFNTPK